MLALHERLLFLRAYPDDARVLAAAERLLAGFARRRDARRCRAALADSGVAGTDLHYPFFYPTALWLARRFPDRLRLDAAGAAAAETALFELLLTALSAAEAVWLRERRPPARRALALLAGRGASDAAFLLERLAALPGDDFTREATHDRVGPDYLLRPGPGTPNRTLARDPGAGVVFRGTPPQRQRPDLAAELARPPRRIIEVRGEAARALVALARDAMVTRARDLDGFCYGDARDVRRIVDHDGLELIAIGSLPERRLLLSTAYGLLAVRNGVPTGYVQLDAFLWTALVHFNTFDTFRGADAGWVFGRVLAAARALFGVEAFAIEPYQLGHGNDEALDSGAWWFYAKLGFRPLDPGLAALGRREGERLRRRPGGRTPRTRLARLAAGHVVYEPCGRAATVPPHAALARAISARLTAAGGDRERALTRLANEVAARIGLGPGSRLGVAERLWLRRWAPLVAALPGFAGWPAAERVALGTLLYAKAGRREAELVPLARSHPRFGPALLELAERHGSAGDLAPALPTRRRG